MKVKQVRRKLSLNKETIVNLNLSEMNDVKGGTGTIDSCPPPTYKCETIIWSCDCVPAKTINRTA